MTGYVYTDGDNVPMNEEAWEQAREAARDIRECQTRERFFDDLNLTGTCRSCEWMIEGVYEQFTADDDLLMPACCYDIAEGLCKVCKATNHDEGAIEKYLEEAGQ